MFNSSNHRASVYSQSGIGMQVHGDEAKEHGVNMEDTLGGALRDHRHYSLQTLSSRLGSPVAIHSIYAAQLNAFSPETQQAARGEHFTMHQSHSHESVNGLGLNDSELESMLKAQQLLTAQPQKTKMELALLASRLEQTSLARQGRLEPLQHRAQQASAHVLRQDIRVPDSDAIPQRNITHSNYGSASSQFHLPDVQHQVAALDPSPALAHALLRDEATRAAGGSVARALGPSSMFERGEAHIVKQEGQAELDAVRNSASNQLTSGIQQAEHGMGPKPESTSLHGDPSLASPMLTDSACTKTLSTSSRRVKPEQRKVSEALLQCEACSTGAVWFAHIQACCMWGFLRSVDYAMRCLLNHTFGLFLEKEIRLRAGFRRSRQKTIGFANDAFVDCAATQARPTLS